MGLGLDGNITFVNAAGGPNPRHVPWRAPGRQALEVFHHSTEDGAQISVDENSFLNVVRNGETRSAETVFRQGDDRSVSSTTRPAQSARRGGSLAPSSSSRTSPSASRRRRRSAAPRLHTVAWWSTPRTACSGPLPKRVLSPSTPRWYGCWATTRRKIFWPWIWSETCTRTLRAPAADGTIPGLRAIENVERRWRRKDEGSSRSGSTAR